MLSLCPNISCHSLALLTESLMWHFDPHNSHTCSLTQFNLQHIFSLSPFCLTVHSLSTTASPTLTWCLSPIAYIRFHLLLSLPTRRLSCWNQPHVSLLSPSVADRMAMPVLIRACMARCSTRLSTGLWERVLLILASGDGLKMTGPKTSRHCLVTLTYSAHTHMHTSNCM